MENIFIILIALALDALLGEVPNRFHPVAWLGNFINFQLRFTPVTVPARQFIFGLATVIITVMIVALPVWLLLHYLGQFSTPAYTIAAALILKCTFAVRGLWQAVGRVGAVLGSGNISLARESLRALVSRDTAGLSEKQVAAASIESCAENICDSFIAPTFFFLLCGPAGAVAYRVINTYDSMIGYHGKWEYAGKFAARLDDVVNYIPARLSGVMLTLAAMVTGNRAEQGWRTMLAEHGRTASPNAGWPMASMAGSLGIMLEKEGHYRLGTATREIDCADVGRSQRIMILATGLWSATMIFAEGFTLAAAQVMR